MQQRDNWMKKSIQVKKVNRNKTQANRNSNHLGHLKVRRKQTRMETKGYLKSHPKKAINPEISNSHTKRMERTGVAKKTNSNHQRKRKKLHPKRHLKKSFIMMC